MRSEKRMEEGYREMASDAEHEQEAEECCEALIGDASEPADSLARNDNGCAPDALSGEKQAGLK